LDAEAIEELLVKLEPQLKEIFTRHGVEGPEAKVILAAAVREVTYRERSRADAERRLLRSVERRCAAWRDEQGDSVETPNGENGEQGR
jgi:hypothetical protein